MINKSCTLCSLKQHNGELKGGAKASRAGRPWVCACLIRGFYGQSEGNSTYTSVALKDCVFPFCLINGEEGSSFEYVDVKQYSFCEVLIEKHVYWIRMLQL